MRLSAGQQIASKTYFVGEGCAPKMPDGRVCLEIPPPHPSNQRICKCAPSLFEVKISLSDPFPGFISVSDVWIW